MTVHIHKDFIYSDDEPGEQGDAGYVLDRMPMYGVERMMGIDDSIPSQGKTVEFRLFDDDGVLCYEGVLTDDEECTNQTAALRWGEGNGGCTLIEVKRDGSWVAEIG